MSSRSISSVGLRPGDEPAVAPRLASAVVQHVRQRSPRDCGVAATAMLARVSYARAASVHPPGRAGGGLQAMDVAVMLRRLTGRTVRLSGAAEGRTLAELAAAAPGPAIVLIHEPESVRGHYVVLADGRILDPELEEGAPIAAYRHRAWRVFRVLTLEEAHAASAA